MKALSIILVCISFTISSISQVSKYSYLKTASTWAYNSSPTAITGLGAGVNDVLSNAVNIGFTFYYQEVAYTQFKASSNGFITFNTANTLAQPTNNLKTSTERYIVAPLWDDNQTSSSGNVNYKLTGTTPNRVLSIEWKALRWNKSGFSAGTIDVQTKLYETSNLIEFVYNRGTYQSFGNSIGIGASIGLSGASSGDFMSISDLSTSATSSTATETTTIGASPTNLTTMTQSGANAAIPNGTMFRMSPPPIALPIELLYFQVTGNNNSNKISWSTLTEHNSDYFNIEKTQDGVTYFNIATINGGGSSTSQLYYEYIDYDITVGLSYYRLKQTDRDGNYIYSPIISIDNSNNKIRIVIKVINLYGSEVDIKTPGVLILIYDDGSIKKIFNN